MKPPPEIRLPQGMEPCLLLAVPLIVGHKKRPVEKNLLGFALTDAVPVSILAAVPIVPVETFDSGKLGHALYMGSIYPPRQPFLSAGVLARKLLVFPQPDHRNVHDPR
jgi:hypothetical protein